MPICIPSRRRSAISSRKRLHCRRLMSVDEPRLRDEAGRTAALLSEAAAQWQPELTIQEVGVVTAVSHGTARIAGLPGVRAEELVRFAGGVTGFAFNL